MFHYPGWRIDDDFWSHTITTENKGEKIAFVHFDTNFLAYGEKGEKGNKGMGQYFKTENWTDQKHQEVLGKIDGALSKYKDANYKIAVGHHPIGHLCEKTRHLPEIS